MHVETCIAPEILNIVQLNNNIGILLIGICNQKEIVNFFFLKKTFISTKKIIEWLKLICQQWSISHLTLLVQVLFLGFVIFFVLVYLFFSSCMFVFFFLKIGHSQGTVMGFAGFSTNQEISTKVDLFIALAPVKHKKHNKQKKIKSFITIYRSLGFHIKLHFYWLFWQIWISLNGSFYSEKKHFYQAARKREICDKIVEFDFFFCFFKLVGFVKLRDGFVVMIQQNAKVSFSFFGI